MSQFALFGSPVSHSLSPLIHQAFAKSLGFSLTYDRIDTPVGKLAHALIAFREQGGMGANVTVPLKIEAYQLCQHLSDNAKYAQAVNTLYWENNELCGDNTDGNGLVKDLTQNLKLDLKNKTLLILGAGGAVRGILHRLLSLLPAKIVLANRTFEKAQALANFSPLIQAYTYETLNASDHAFDIVINATSASLQQQIPDISPRWIKNVVAIDLAYQKNQDTVFLTWAKEHGAKATHDGVGMLVEQAALSFYRWHNTMPTTLPVIIQLKQGNLK